MPSTIDADTAIHVVVPKLRLPTSENACPLSFFNFVHRTTSQGGDGVSVSPASCSIWLLIETCRECGLMKPGELERGTFKDDMERREENRRSNGRNDGVGLSRPGLDATDGNIPLPAGEDKIEPYQILAIFCCVHDLSYLDRGRIIWNR